MRLPTWLHDYHEDRLNYLTLTVTIVFRQIFSGWDWQITNSCFGIRRKKRLAPSFRFFFSQGRQDMISHAGKFFSLLILTATWSYINREGFRVFIHSVLNIPQNKRHPVQIFTISLDYIQLVNGLLRDNWLRVRKLASCCQVSPEKYNQAKNIPL